MAWANTYLEMRKHPKREISPFAVTFEAPTKLSLAATLADPLVKALDACLDHDEHQTVENVAFTIFPERI
jgi:hypothetical protein